MTPAERQSLIAKYKAGYDEVVRALAGMAADERDWRPAPGEWSAREVVHHLADSETISGIRLRRLLIEDNPVIQGYDEAEYARHFRYQDRPWEPALQRVPGGPVHHGAAPRVHDGGRLAPAPARTRRVGRTRRRSGSASTPTTATSTPSRSARTARAGLPGRADRVRGGASGSRRAAR